MQKVILIVLILLSSLTFAQGPEMPMTFGDFKSWVEGVDFPGFTRTEVYAAEGVFAADYENASSEIISLNLNVPEDFYTFKQMTGNMDLEPYEYDGFTVVYSPINDQMSFFSIKADQMDATITLFCMPVKTQSEMEALFDAIGLGYDGTAGEETGSSSSAEWPGEITEDMRLGGTIKQISKQNPSTDGVVYQYAVYASMGPELIESLKYLMKKYNGTLNLIDMGDFWLICLDAGNIDDLGQWKNEGDAVEFIYYKKQ